MLKLTGLPTAHGCVSGPAFIYRGDGEMPVPEYLVEQGREADELLRVKRAQQAAMRDLESLISVLRQRSGDVEAKVFECHAMLLEDPMLVDEVKGYVLNDRLNAEAAIRKTADNARKTFARMNDAYFRERVRDLDDLERRLLKNLMGFSSDPLSELKVPSILVADDLTPNEAVRLPRDLVLGFATNAGSTTSHVALVARALGIPAVTGLGHVTTEAVAGETMLLDGTNGVVILSPDESAQRDFADQVERRRAFVKDALSECAPGTLKDGGEIRIYANIHPGVPYDNVRDLGARGIGLFRSEYLWLNSEGEPSEIDQFTAYREAVRFAATLAPDATITIRALDIGGDKVVRGISQLAESRTREANPFLGNRSIRYLLSHRDVFRTQLRAILKASCFGHVRLMYPMVSCVEELTAAASVLDDVKRELSSEHVSFDPDMPVGAMIEVPAAALAADALACHVDFFSIGTNDLVQYAMAADRGNDGVAHLYQPLHRGVLRLVDMTIAAARAHGIPVSVCGESAADPVVGVLWAAMGVDTLSMSATFIPRLAKVFSRLTRADLGEYHDFVRQFPVDATASSVTASCRDWMKRKIPDLDAMLI